MLFFGWQISKLQIILPFQLHRTFTFGYLCTTALILFIHVGFLEYLCFKKFKLVVKMTRIESGVRVSKGLFTIYGNVKIVTAKNFWPPLYLYFFYWEININIIKWSKYSVVITRVHTKYGNIFTTARSARVKNSRMTCTRDISRTISRRKFPATLIHRNFTIEIITKKKKTFG
jgi:hypothetical protein